jgi:hypothetical protein
MPNRARKRAAPEVIELARQLLERYLQDVEGTATDEKTILRPYWRKFASIGGKARAKSLSSARRREIARKAGRRSGAVRAARARARREAANSEPVVNSEARPKK